MNRIILLGVAVITLASCELDPQPIQDQSSEDLWSHATYGEGILTRAYTGLDNSYPIFMDTYTDNAVPSVPGLNSLALGNWTVENNPIGNWEESYNNIKYLNIFLENSKDLIYQVSDPTRDSILKVHRRGEAFFLRAWYTAQLLKHYAGPVNSEILGIPVVTEALDLEDDLDLARDDYEVVVQQIVEDLDSAIVRLPLKYDNGSDPFSGLVNRGRASGLGAMALKARVYLNAASPAYGPSTQQLWARAAEAAAEAIIASGGLDDLEPFGNFNDATSFDNIWIQPTYVSSNLERNYYPPSLFGNGLINPSQNLVDAFPAEDGYPVHLSGQYSEDAPYDSLDPRFDRFIFFNGDEYNGTIIETFEGGSDAPGGLSQQGTRTGYYLKKLLSKDVELTPGDITSDVKFYVFLGMTELYLNFAEAANEAYGPMDASLGFSALDAMMEIRERAGIDSDESLEGYQDEYLVSQANEGKDAFRALIHNERRIELAFEGFRFWDIRRWGLPLDHTIEGVRIIRNNGTFSYEYFPVERHVYEDYMRYVPLPYSQTLIMDNLKQNDGWN